MRLDRVSGVLMAILMAACAATTPRGNETSGPSWPPDDPRVVFDRVIGTEEDLGRSSFFRRLVGQKVRPLFERPHGVAWDGNDLLVTDPGAGAVLRLTDGSRIERTRSGILEGPIDVVPCLGGVVVSDARAGRVALFDGDLRFRTWLVEDLDRPTGLACLGGGEVAVAETGAHRIVILGLDGIFRRLGTRGNGEGQFNFPVALARFGENILVGDTLNFRVQEIDAETGLGKGSFGSLGDSAGETPRIKGLALGIDGTIWVSDAHLDVVAVFDHQGHYLMQMGEHGTGEGEFDFPAGLAISADGRIAVVDAFNRRIEVFRMVVRPEGGSDEDR